MRGCLVKAPDQVPGHVWQFHLDPPCAGRGPVAILSRTIAATALVGTLPGCTQGVFPRAEVFELPPVGLPVPPLPEAMAKGAIRLIVNGEVKQDADLSEVIWSIPGMISILSHSMELRPGDLITTATPAGVGPLGPGDVCAVSLEGLGELTTKVAPRA